MWEVTLFDEGLEVGTWDWDECPEVGAIVDGCKVVNIRAIDSENCTAEVDVEYVV